MKQLSREHQAVFNFETAVAQLRPVTETDVDEADYKNFYDSFTSAVSNFINSELHFRQADRCETVGVNPDLETYSRDYGTELNDRGIAMLGNARDALNDFIEQQGALPTTGDEFEAELSDYADRLKRTMVSLEIKASDASELSEAIDQAIATLAPGANGADLLNYASTKIQELIDVRGEDGRGADTNIPIWKLIAAAVLLVLGLWVVYKCYYSRWLCSKKEKAIYNTILSVAMIVFGACE